MSAAYLDHAIETELDLLDIAKERGSERAIGHHEGAIAAYASMKVRQETENEIVRMMVAQSVGSGV